MPHNERGDSPCPDAARFDRVLHVGPPPCQWAKISGESRCYEPSELARLNLLLCLPHARQVADVLGWQSPARARERAEKAVAAKLDQLRQDLTRVTFALQEATRAPAKKPGSTLDAPGTIYFLRSGGYFKIGWTTNLERRMKSYPPATQLLAAQPGTQRQERAIHRRFAHLIARGREWFVLSPEIEDHIDRVVAEHGRPPVVDFAAKRATRTTGRPKQYVGGPNRGRLAARQVRG